jgi:hypothetical protein
VRLGEDLRPPDVEPPPPPDLSVSPPPLRAPRAGELRGEPTPSVMERAIDSFPLAHVIPDATVIPTVSTRTTEVHDGTSDGRIEASRAEARREARGRPDPVLPPPTLPDREAERVDQGLRDAIARGGFCESPAGAGSPDCPPAD